MRAGSYHESVILPAGKQLVVQSYPNEAVWLDGSTVVSGWSASGSAWRATGWTTRLDSSATYTRGASDGTAAGWSFVGAQNPMASHPDQVWIGDTPLRQVGSLGEVTTGTFYVDYATSSIYVGSNPTGKTVRSSDLVKALSIRSDGSTLRGIGVRRYAPSVPDMGAITLERPGITVENVAVQDTSTTGISAVSTDATLRHVTVTGNGMLGIHGSMADSLVVQDALVTGNNSERFNTSPVAGGIKVTRTTGVTVRDSVVTDNLGTGVWLDESCADITVSGTTIARNASHGISLELSADALVAGNHVLDNSGDGIKINDTSRVQVWNNTFAGNGRTINIVQDARNANDKSTPGHDPRRPVPDASMTWTNGPVTVSSNILSTPRSGATCLLCVEDYSHRFTAEQTKVASQGNVYARTSTARPTWWTVWSRGAGDPAVFTSMTDFTKATGQDAASLVLDGKSAVDTSGAATVTVREAEATVAVPLPAAVASELGVKAGTRHLGAWD